MSQATGEFTLTLAKRNNRMLLTTLDHAPEPQVTHRTDSMNHEDEMIHLWELTWKKSLDFTLATYHHLLNCIYNLTVIIIIKLHYINNYILKWIAQLNLTHFPLQNRL